MPKFVVSSVAGKPSRKLFFQFDFYHLLEVFVETETGKCRVATAPVHHGFSTFGDFVLDDGIVDCAIKSYLDGVNSLNDCGAIYRYNPNN